MQSVWQLNDRPELLLFFSGWGMDERPTAHLTSKRFDVCTCFDYNTLETPEYGSWRSYESISLVGWSMGVWAAEQVLTGRGLRIRRAVAVNGTPRPVDDAWGIPLAMARATLEGLNPESLRRFYRRMAGGGAALKALENAGFLPRIELDERREELRRIVARMPYPDTGFVWNRAVVGTGDAVFPPSHLLAYWRERAEIAEIDAPHYPFHLFETWEEVIGEQDR